MFTSGVETRRNDSIVSKITVESTDSNPRGICKLIDSREFSAEQYIAAKVYAEGQYDRGYWVSIYNMFGECIAEYPINGKVR